MTDPVTVAVIAAALRAICWEMSEALRRSAHSPIIREMYDFSCGVFSAEGETVAQDELIPAFLGTMASTMPFVLESVGDQHIDEGDAFFTNDPYRGGTHTPDVQVFVPLLREGRVVAWCGNIAHHSDLGGTNPGTEGYANGSIFEEGLRIPPVRLVEAGRLNEPLLRVIENNIRDPQSTAGDLRAQLAAAKLGQRRLGELFDRYGTATIQEAMAVQLDQSERRIRAAIAAREDGTASAEGWLDDDGLGSDPVRVAVTVEVAGNGVRIDLTGSHPQIAGGMNMSETAAKAAIYFAVKAIFDPDAPHNGAIVRPIEMVLPEGSIANPRFPAAVSLRHLAVQRLTDTMVHAFSRLYPDLATAGSFVGFSSIAAAGPHPRTGAEVVLQDDLGGGVGAHAGGDGLDAVDVYLGNVQILPAEICEMQYPVRIVDTSLVPDSAGPGRFRGGLAIRRIYEFLTDADAVVYSEQTRPEAAPAGMEGGHDGTSAELRLERADGTAMAIRKRRVTMRPGDRLVVTTGGGGGFGDPAERSPEAVAADLREGKISERAATDVYAGGLAARQRSA